MTGTVSQEPCAAAVASPIRMSGLVTLRAVFVADTSTKRLGFTGARCELPNGQVVETKGRRTPLYDLARKLEAMGFGDWTLQAYTPTGTPSLRGKVSVVAGLAVEENDKTGLRLRKFRPMPVGGLAKDAHLGPEGTQNHRIRAKRS